LRTHYQPAWPAKGGIVLKRSDTCQWYSIGYLVLGFAAGGLYHWLYTGFMQDKASMLLAGGSVAEILLWVLTALAAVGAFVLCRRKGIPQPSRLLGAFGDLVFAAGVASLWLEEPHGPVVLVRLYQVFICAGAASMFVSAVLRARGKKQNFLLEIAPCVLCILQLVECYQLWSEVPQLMDYVLGVGAILFLTLTAYHRMARVAGLKTCPRHYAFGLLSVYFCCAAVFQGDSAPFYAAAAIWVMTDLTALTAVEKKA